MVCKVEYNTCDLFLKLQQLADLTYIKLEALFAAFGTPVSWSRAGFSTSHVLLSAPEAGYWRL